MVAPVAVVAFSPHPLKSRSKVHDARSTLAVDEHIGWLDISVDEALAVREGQPAENILKNTQRFTFRQPTS